MEDPMLDSIFLTMICGNSCIIIIVVDVIIHPRFLLFLQRRRHYAQ
jgi:hypothetical protein